MTSNPKSFPGDHQQNETLRQQCMLYLLDELSAEQVTEFESQLASSAGLQRELETQAEWIAAVATAANQPALTPSEVHIVSDSAIPIGSHRTNQKWIAAAVAIAACLALIFAAVRPATESRQVASTEVNGRSDSEDLLIARAWAVNLDDFELDDLEVDEFEVDELDTEPELALENDNLDDGENDDTLQWMFIAVATDSDAEDRSDG